MSSTAATSSAAVVAAMNESSATCEVVDGCITCGDVAVEMEILRIDHERELALCECDAGRESVEIALVQPVAVGDRLLVHAGTAIAHLQPNSADAGARKESPRRRRGQVIQAGAEQL